ncbi:MAG: Ppx/GppA phosphatase family protein [Ignavibacterium sp.]|jgi:exopolyphosphatase/guanosine-5'-triphosphate,3'-diphosphate pyrophosphatase|nr:Ppx/GppA phosphatase family protein [Ignavibacterium sp.]
MDKTKNRIAAIDIGTNSFHLIILEITNNNKLKLLDRDRVFLRIGNIKQNGLNIISKSDTEAAVNVLLKFKQLADFHKARIFAIATSAVREASNNKEFISEVFNRTRVKIKIIDGKSEAKLIFLGMKNALDLSSSNVLGIDIGGGSTEFIYAVNGKVKYADSVKIGAVRLSNVFFSEYKITKSAVSACEDYVEAHIQKQIDMKIFRKIDIAVGSSGTVDTICMIKNIQSGNAVRKKLNGFEFSYDEFEDIYNLIMNLRTPDERMNVPGLESKRADIIPAGLIILKKIFQLFDLNKMILSEYALREGIVFKALNLN